MSELYNSYWDTYKKKVAYQGKIAKYLGEYMTDKYSNKPVSEIKFMLSVGHGKCEFFRVSYSTLVKLYAIQL